MSGDATKCVLNTDLSSNCYEGVRATTPVCSICKAGYAFVDGVCKKNANATFENGCFDEISDKKCWFCISGWSMGTDLKCTNNNPTPPPNNFIGIGKIVAWLALLFF